ncbi:type II toxin-antitoxin system RelE/ParE family toxin [Arthrobacter sp. UM1]|uniref:type II toxin-antitoxin system RelE/ParE family toxin n=1 Tax=Arthrobacter sp. UM1 TaxID=2766776 RepID=UPI001CF70D8F|nr:type II toxin-antitoxin system RelE/ParE family toxin [Arthrobacter sp. UM1]MCB4208206.1 type II toxin-antitoxin system RelE/ParE family toxin [Arthrobacter sp. UM1]
MIRSFRDKRTARVWDRRFVAGVDQRIQRGALRKLESLHAAVDVMDLRVPPGNRLERLKGDRSGRFSIRVNDQWRICFAWRDGSAEDVELTDYH